MAGSNIDAPLSLFRSPDRGIISRGKSGIWLFEIRNDDISTLAVYNLSLASGIIQVSDPVDPALLEMCNYALELTGYVLFPFVVSLTEIITLSVSLFSQWRFVKNLIYHLPNVNFHVPVISPED